MRVDQAIDTVKSFLKNLEDRDLDSAKALVADNFEMVFPGDVRFKDFDALIAWAKPRYRWVKKHHDRFDAAQTDDGIVVFCHGTLYGEDPLGAPFEGIRYADWFLIVGGKISKQHVWNDLAEVRRAL